MRIATITALATIVLLSFAGWKVYQERPITRAEARPFDMCKNSVDMVNGLTKELGDFLDGKRKNDFNPWTVEQWLETIKDYKKDRKRWCGWREWTIWDAWTR